MSQTSCESNLKYVRQAKASQMVEVDADKSVIIGGTKVKVVSATTGCCSEDTTCYVDCLNSYTSACQQILPSFECAKMQ